MLELGTKDQEAAVLRFGAEPHHDFDARPIVPAPIEDHDFAGGREMGHVALQVELRLLAVGRRRQRHHPEHPRTDPFGDRLDHPALAGGVAALEHDDDPQSLVLDPFLQAAELDLQFAERLVIVLAVHRLLGGAHGCRSIAPNAKAPRIFVIYATSSWDIPSPDFLIRIMSRSLSCVCSAKRARLRPRNFFLFLRSPRNRSDPSAFWSARREERRLEAETGFDMSAILPISFVLTLALRSGRDRLGVLFSSFCSSGRLSRRRYGPARSKPGAASKRRQGATDERSGERSQGQAPPKTPPLHPPSARGR